MRPGLDDKGECGGEQCGNQQGNPDDPGVRQFDALEYSNDQRHYGNSENLNKSQRVAVI